MHCKILIASFQKALSFLLGLYNLELEISLLFNFGHLKSFEIYNNDHPMPCEFFFINIKKNTVICN